METFKQLRAFPLYATVGYSCGWRRADEREGLRGVLFTSADRAGVLDVWPLHAPGATRAGRSAGQPGRLRRARAWLAGPTRSGHPGGERRRRRRGEVGAVEPGRGRQRRARAASSYWTSPRAVRTCQTNKKLVFSSRELRDYFAANKIATCAPTDEPRPAHHPSSRAGARPCRSTSSGCPAATNRSSSRTVTAGTVLERSRPRRRPR